MRYIIQKRPGKVHVREHDRKTKHKVADVSEHNRSRPTSRRKIGNVTVRIPLKDLNYKQAKKRFPGLNPRGDIDKDGVINKRDCKPFDIDRQDDAQDIIDSANDDEAYENLSPIDKRRVEEGLSVEEYDNGLFTTPQKELEESSWNILTGREQKEKKSIW